MVPLNRTPPPLTDNNNNNTAPQTTLVPQSTSPILFTPHVPHNQQNLFYSAVTQLNNNGKRAAEETAYRSINDVYDFLINRFNGFSNEIKDMRADNTQFGNRMDEKIDSIKDLMNVTEQKLKTMDAKIDTNEKRIENNEKAMNFMMQEKLMNRMEISGFKSNSGNDKNMLRDEVVELLKSHNINIGSDDINFVFTKTINMNKNGIPESKSLIIVDFKEFGTKVSVMKEKRSSTKTNGVYFDNCLTPTNRSLMGSVKKIAKEKKFKTYISNNRIHAKKSENKVQTVEAASDLKIVESWSPNKEAATSSNVNQTSV
jgi:hypothetical protein